MDRWAHIYEEIERPFSLESLAAELAPSGLRLERPGHGAAVAHAPPSYYTEVSRETLCTAVRLATKITLSFWWPDDFDMACSIRLIGAVRQVTIDLPLATREPEQAKALGNALASMAAARIRDRTLVGYVYDPDDAASGAYWDELFLQGKLPERWGRLGEGWNWPRVVLARKEMAPLLRGTTVVRERRDMVAAGTNARRWRRG